VSEHYTVTSQSYSAERQEDGSYEPSVDVGFRTKTTPPVDGTVSVPRSLMSDAPAYAAAVHAKIMEAVRAHAAAAAL